jgi:hypothetical protein
MKLLDGAELLGVHSNRQEVLRAVFENGKLHAIE